MGGRQANGEAAAAGACRGRTGGDRRACGTEGQGGGRAGNGAPAVAPKAPPKAAPAVLDRRTLSRLSRGITAVDARIDLHGLTQSLAHRRLLRFLDEAQAHGARVVLVITGKGKPGEPAEYGFAERGVLRRAVPQWLQSADFQPMVSGFAEAGRRHGGAGAVYVRIRRRRD